MQNVDPFRQYNRHGDYEGYPYNEKEMVKLCPKEFKENNNAWAKFAARIISDDKYATIDWKWKTDDLVKRGEQLFYLVKWLGMFLPYKSRLAVAAWMLSEMLKEIPVD